MLVLCYSDMEIIFNGIEIIKLRCKVMLAVLLRNQWGKAYFLEIIDVK